MTRNVARQLSIFRRYLFPSAIALALIAMPVSLSSPSSDLLWKAAFAKKGGGKGGNGGGRGGGKGSDKGSDKGGRGGSSDKSDRSNGSSRGVGSKADRGQGASDSAPGRADRNIAKAKDRYQKSIRGKAKTQATVKPAAFEREARGVSHRFSRAETQTLIDNGWQAEQPLDGFKNHGQRVKTMVELAKRLGYSARVGALQANFGTPQETGVAELQASLAAAREEALTNPDTAGKVAELEAAWAEAMHAKPGNGTNDEWATLDLDVNRDGSVDRHDLLALGPRESDAKPDNDDSGDDDDDRGGDDGDQGEDDDDQGEDEQ